MADLIYPLSISTLFARNWWVLLLRGIAAILFGLLAFTRPVATLATLVLLFGIYVLADGIFSLFAALTSWRRRKGAWMLLLEGLVGIGAGLVTLRAPSLTAVMLMFFIAAWALAIGALRIAEAIRLRAEISGEFWLALSGLASIILGLLVFLRPAAGALAMAWVIGWYALFAGAMLVMLSFRVHRLARPGWRS